MILLYYVMESTVDSDEHNKQDSMSTKSPHEEKKVTEWI